MNLTRVLAVGLMVAAAVVGYLLLRPPVQMPVTMSGGSTDTPGPSPTYDVRYDTSSPLTHQMYAVANSAEQLRRLAWEPADVTSHLISHATYAAWEGTLIDSPYPLGPVWLVAFSGPGLTMEKVNDDIGGQLGHPQSSATNDGGGGGANASSESPPVEGVYYAWDASSGDLIGEGVLGPSTSWTFASVAAMSDLIATIEPATAMPAYPTSDPAYFTGPNAP